MFAEVELQPGGIISWLIFGLIAGWLTGLFFRGPGYGILMDLILGLIGALIGGLIVSLLITGPVGFWGSIVVCFIGAVVLVAIVQALSVRTTV
jgi:uncharacterized membrane protein YeaQ/YmgE (transglycosylase-associated protein family)